MGNFFMRTRLVEFVPEQWQQGLGEICVSCNHKLENDDSISLCKCYLFCHEHCFLKQFSPHIFDNDQLICMRCQEQVRFKFSYIARWECNKKPAYIIALTFVALILLTFLVLVATGTIKDAVSNGAGYAIFGIGMVFLIASTIYSMRKRYINLDKLRVVNTNLLGAPETDAEMKNMDYENDLKKQHHGYDNTNKQLPYEIQ